jgi:hypothetical protein
MNNEWSAGDETEFQFDSKQHRLNLVSAQLKLFLNGELAISDQRIDELKAEALQLARELNVPSPLLYLMEDAHSIINQEDYIPPEYEHYFGLVQTSLALLFNPILSPKGFSRLDQRLMYPLTVLILTAMFLSGIVGSAGVGMLFNRTMLNFDNFDALSIFCDNPHEC